jgi:hypothetical protein
MAVRFENHSAHWSGRGVTGEYDSGGPRLLIDPRNGRTRPPTEAASLLSCIL